MWQLEHLCVVLQTMAWKQRRQYHLIRWHLSHRFHLVVVAGDVAKHTIKWWDHSWLHSQVCPLLAWEGDWGCNWALSPAPQITLAKTNRDCWLHAINLPRFPSPLHYSHVPALVVEELWGPFGLPCLLAGVTWQPALHGRGCQRNRLGILMRLPIAWFFWFLKNVLRITYIGIQWMVKRPWSCLVKPIFVHSQLSSYMAMVCARRTCTYAVYSSMQFST